MNLSEVFIIYLSLGAPVGVYRFQQRRVNQSGGEFLASLIACALWPVVLIDTILSAPAATNSDFETDAASDSEIDELVQKLFVGAKIELSRSGHSEIVADFRELVERYTGLARASRSAGNDAPNAEFYVAAGHPNIEIAKACARRRNSKRLSSHFDAAATEIRNFFSILPEIADGIKADAARLAERVGDVDTFNYLDAMIPKTVVFPKRETSSAISPDSRRDRAA